MSPRHYAFAYLAVKGDKQAEKEALRGCPSEWRDLVKKHIELIEGKKRVRDISKEKRPTR